MFLDDNNNNNNNNNNNKTIAVEQEEKNIKLQKIRIDFSFKREVYCTSKIDPVNID